MLTREQYDVLAEHAASTARDSQMIKGLRSYLYSKQNHLCWDCGEELNGYTDGSGTEICHIHGGIRSAGIVPGNVALGHRQCNVRQARAFGTVVPWQYVAPRAHRIVTQWLPRSVLVSIGKADAQTRDEEDSIAVRRMRLEAGLD